jgi:hypothetical protein
MPNLGSGLDQLLSMLDSQTQQHVSQGEAEQQLQQGLSSQTTKEEEEDNYRRGGNSQEYSDWLLSPWWMNEYGYSEDTYWTPYESEQAAREATQDGGWFYPPPPSGGGRRGPGKIKWSEFDIPVAGAPDWWKALKPSRWTPESEYIALTNLMMPFLSPEDQRQVGTHLFQMLPEDFGHLDPETLDIPAPAAPLGTDIRSQFQQASRGGNAINVLEALLGTVGRERKDFGPGYNYLRSLADVIGDFGGAGNLPTRTQRTQFRAALDPLLAQSKSGPLQAYQGLARSLTNPFFSAGLLDPVMKNRAGQSWYGSPNPSWF